MLSKAYSESAMNKARVYEWYKRFQDGLEDVADDDAPGVPLHQQPTKMWKKLKI